MIFTAFSKVSFAIFVTSLMLFLTQKAKAHSYADCIDWRFKNSKNPSWSDKNGVCFGYARRFPLKAKPFAKLDSDDPNRHYQQSHKNPDPSHSLACSNGKEGAEPGADETMGNPISVAYNNKDKRGRKTGVQTISKPGGELCIRWPAKNHAVPDEKIEPVTIALSEVNPKRDPTQLQFLNNIVAKLNYKNCTDKHENSDIWPCGGCFKLPTNLKPGNVVMQWRWRLNSNEWYTSCADINIMRSPVASPNTTSAVSVAKPSADIPPTTTQTPSMTPTTSVSSVTISAIDNPPITTTTPISQATISTVITPTINTTLNVPTSTSAVSSTTLVTDTL
ncbi:hypothetical protein BGZ96_011440 [Linnemannia gamsii]|uniref:Chitin-binding type-4 domain-containing protein n=1 Tax=Linnemannia gamsii TaxID=64522 RepID=A0ABQ7JSQ5_9FUNG|nr:hypothetical protein BGZ96_011440 [Linnemannia gamsii]